MQNKIIIKVPKRLDFATTIKFGRQIDELPLDSKFIFDFDEMNFVGPFGFVMIAARVRDLALRMPQGSVSVKNYQQHSYHAHMGFFRAFGVDFGDAPGEATGSGNYLPITVVNVRDIQGEAVQSGYAIGEVVDQEARRLANVLASRSKGELVDVFTYCLCEIIRNVAEHSNSKIVQFCAQYCPSQDRAEIVILDRGDGIAKTLRNNCSLGIEDERHALNLSLLPGISGKSHNGTKQTSKYGWHNSGYGLYMTSRMCRHGGSFFIGSHTSALALSAKTKTYFDFQFSGTVVRMVFRPSALGKIQEALARYNKEGMEIAKTIDGAVVCASSASRMIASDFEER